jgi:prepilin-type processing-associated H-X9-DG protein
MIDFDDFPPPKMCFFRRIPGIPPKAALGWQLNAPFKIANTIMLHPPSIRNKNDSGITLTELMATLAIVTVLSICLIAGVRQIQEKMGKAGCLHNMRVVAGAVLAYASDNDLSYPLAGNGAWDVPLSSYLDGNPSAANPVMKCPADTRPLVQNGTQFSRSYSLNGNLPAKTLITQEPSRTIMLAEWYTGEAGPGGASLNYQYSPDYSVVTYNLAGLPNDYHRKVSNFVFCDGHAESQAPLATLLPTSSWTIR